MSFEVCWPLFDSGAFIVWLLHRSAKTLQLRLAARLETFNPQSGRLHSSLALGALPCRVTLRASKYPALLVSGPRPGALEAALLMSEGEELVYIYLLITGSAPLKTPVLVMRVRPTR
jgi:hypothetical protein